MYGCLSREGLLMCRGQSGVPLPAQNAAAAPSSSGPTPQILLRALRLGLERWFTCSSCIGLAREGKGDADSVHWQRKAADGLSTDDEPHLGAEHRTLYFSSDQVIPVHFPMHAKGFERMESWDKNNTNVWFILLDSML